MFWFSLRRRRLKGAACSVGRLLSLIPLNNLWTGWRAHLETTSRLYHPGAHVHWAGDNWGAAEYLLLHRFLVSLSRLMTFSLYNSTHGADPGPSRDTEEELAVGAILMRQRNMPEEECKGFNERILEEKEGFVNSLVPQHPAHLS